MNSTPDEPVGGANVPPAVAAMRLLWAFVLFAMGPQLVAEALLASGAVAVPAGDGPRAELALLAFGITAVAVAAFAVWQPPAALRPWRIGLVVGSYLPMLVAWTGLLVGYLRTMHGLGQAVPPQPGLTYFVLHRPDAFGFWLAAVVTALGAPLAEELLFRGFLHSLLRCWLGPWPAIVAGALLFGLLHGLHYALPIAALGLFFGWLRERSGSLLPSMVAHALHNTVVVFVTVYWPATLDWLYPR